LRDVALASDVRVFERSAVQGVVADGASVTIEVPKGRIRANQVILTANAFTGDLNVAPRRLSKPVRVTAVETDRVSPDLLDEAGWSSRLPIVTTHRVMESYRTTSRDTIVFTTRRLQMPRNPVREQQPDQAVVAELVRGFRERFPTLGGVLPQRAWSGWIGMTPSNLAVAGRAAPRVFYSMACNGHGLGEAPYLGNLLAEHVAGKDMHDDLRAVWRESPRFAPGVVNPLSLRAAWVADRLSDRLDRRR
jgi:glycine/D-amino acid oxidase-like deaminating enzyme